LPAFSLAVACVLVGGSFVGVGGCAGSSDRPAARAGLVASSHARAADRTADMLDAQRPGGSTREAPLATLGVATSLASSPPPAAATRGLPAVPQAASADSRIAAASPSPELEAPLRVKRLVLARDVAEREPVSASDRFARGEADRIYAFVEVENPERAESEIHVTFEPADGAPTGHVRLRVGPSSRWRTWAYTRGARSPGAWEAVVRDASGTVLARAPFAIES
jgi:hypothetical protein